MSKMAFPKIDGYIVTEKLGSGSYSTVYKAHTKVGARSIVAIKCVDKSKVKHSGSAIDNLITEIRLLKTLSHPHIVHMKNFTWDDRNIFIIMEYCCGGDLSRYILKYGRLPEKQVMFFLQQLASALKFLREKGVVHMDLKPHNLLLHKSSDGKYTLKVADFGFAQHMSAVSLRSVRGSPLYMAPEMVSGDYDARVDLWSVGVILYECLFGKAPYSSSTFKELMDKIQRRAPIELPPTPQISPGCQDLLTRLLQHDPDKRISYEEFFNHQYLDLDHMPSKENYEKAVILIKKAIELDAAGRLEEAFTAYRDSLLYLVPCVGCENDSLRRAALTAKLTRYMERAEELKLCLHRGRTTASCSPGTEKTPICHGTASGHVPATGHPSTTGEVTAAGHATATGQVSSAGHVPSACLHNEQTDLVRPENGVDDNAGLEDIAGGSGPNAAQAQQKSRFPFKRFFTRNSSLPYLEPKDSSITAELPDEKKIPVAETTDACRIT